MATTFPQQTDVHDRVRPITLPVAATEPLDWRAGLPTLTTGRGTLRELTLDDAASLTRLLTADEVARFISPPPTTVAGFENFILWTHRRRAEGRYACFGIVPAGQTAAVGFFQVRLLEDTPDIAEWGFAMGSAHWGSGLFIAGARQVLAFVFRTLGIERLEAKSVVENGRGNGALRKTGATLTDVIRGSFTRAGRHFDQALWVITREDWRTGVTERRRTVQWRAPCLGRPDAA